MTKEFSGKVKDEVVDTYGGDYTYELQVGGESIESIFRGYEGQRITFSIDTLPDEDENEQDYEDEDDE